MLASCIAVVSYPTIGNLLALDNICHIWIIFHVARENITRKRLYPDKFALDQRASEVMQAEAQA